MPLEEGTGASENPVPSSAMPEPEKVERAPANQTTWIDHILVGLVLKGNGTKVLLSTVVLTTPN